MTTGTPNCAGSSGLWPAAANQAAADECDVSNRVDTGEIADGVQMTQRPLLHAAPSGFRAEGWFASLASSDFAPMRNRELRTPYLFKAFWMSRSNHQKRTIFAAHRLVSGVGDHRILPIRLRACSA